MCSCLTSIVFVPCPQVSSKDTTSTYLRVPLGEGKVFNAMLGIEQVLNTFWLKNTLRIIIVIGTKRMDYSVEGKIYLVLQ